MPTRTLYENREQELFDAIRPVILNGIADVATRPDLLDRAIILTMPPIPESQRRPESKLWEEFEEACPEILGFLFDAVSAALRNLPETKLGRLPRMADFALWVSAAEEALGWEKDSFVRIYNDNRGDANRQALETSPVAAAVWKLMQREDEWAGTPTQLLRALASVTGEDRRRTKTLPSAPNALSVELKRLAPALRVIGIEAEDFREPTSLRRRMWRISHIEDGNKGSSGASEPSEELILPCKTEGGPADGLRTVPGGLGRSSDDPRGEYRPDGSPANELPSGGVDDLDDGSRLTFEVENDDSIDGEA